MGSIHLVLTPRLALLVVTDPEGLTLPAEYHDWAEQSRLAVASEERSATHLGTPPVNGHDSVHSYSRITSPAEGDVYHLVPRVDPLYATIGLRATGPSTSTRVRWYVDDRLVIGGRRPLVPGKHRIRAEVGGLWNEIGIEVVGQP